MERKNFLRSIGALIAGVVVMPFVSSAKENGEPAFDQKLLQARLDEIKEKFIITYDLQSIPDGWKMKDCFIQNGPLTVIYYDGSKGTEPRLLPDMSGKGKFEKGKTVFVDVSAHKEYKSIGETFHSPFTTRIRWSGPKLNENTIDQFGKFLPANFKDNQA